jgi:hypothetical protein
LRNTHFLLLFGDFDKSFSLDNAHASMALRSLNHDSIVHEAVALVQSLVETGNRCSDQPLARKIALLLFAIDKRCGFVLPLCQIGKNNDLTIR